MSFVVHYVMNKRYINLFSYSVYTFKSLSCYSTLAMLVFLCLFFITLKNFPPCSGFRRFGSQSSEF